MALTEVCGRVAAQLSIQAHRKPLRVIQTA
jgi:hypothetical protein